MYQPKNITTQKRNLPRDVFLHLFAMVTLYWSAISFITLCWQFINYFFPDGASFQYGYQPHVWPIRFAVSSLIIIFPLFILSSWYLNKIYRRETSTRESKIRKWLIYLTLFIASLILIGDLVSVVFHFLGGEVTVKFVLKAFSVFLVAGAVFGYYIDDVRSSAPPKSAKYISWVSGAVVLAMLVGAFFIIGSPKSARLAQLDQQRVNDLQNIQWQIVNYWQRKGTLPETLSDLEDPISGYIIFTDPGTGEAYEYRVKDANLLIFELCAHFQTERMGQQTVAFPERGVEQQHWNHLAERTCFERIIDPELYPMINREK